MPTYTYEAVANDGSVLSGTLEADDQTSATRQIEKGGAFVTSIAAGSVVPKQKKSSGLFQRSIPRTDVTILLSDLASLINSQLRIDEAIELMLEELDLGKTKTLLDDILGRLRGGESLSSALSVHPDVFEPLEVEMIRLAETSGGVGDALAQISEDRELQEKVQTQIYSSLRYPVFLLLGSIGILIFFLIYVIPQFEIVLTQAQGDTGALGAVLGVSKWLKQNSDLIMIGMILLLVLALIGSRLSPVRAAAWGIVLRLPLVGTIAATYRNARICQLIGQTQRSGVQLPVALGVIGPAVDGPAERNISVNAVDGLRQGRKLADVLSEFAGMQDLAIRMIRVGEESSQVGALSARAGRLYQARMERQLTRLVGIVGPLTLIVISIVIGSLIVLIMTSLLSLNEMIAF